MPDIIQFRSRAIFCQQIRPVIKFKRKITPWYHLCKFISQACSLYNDRVLKSRTSFNSQVKSHTRNISCESYEASHCKGLGTWRTKINSQLCNTKILQWFGKQHSECSFGILKINKLEIFRKRNTVLKYYFIRD